MLVVPNKLQGSFSGLRLRRLNTTEQGHSMESEQAAGRSGQATRAAKVTRIKQLLSKNIQSKVKFCVERNFCNQRTFARYLPIRHHLVAEQKVKTMRPYSYSVIGIT